MLKHHAITFIINVIIGITLNPMNLLAYRFDDLYLSLTLFYGGLTMASNMIWSHEIIKYLVSKEFNFQYFIFGITLLAITIFIMRKQILIDDKQYIRRMIGHHSTALTTSHEILEKTKNKKLKKLAKDIIDSQEGEIHLMKEMLNE